MKLSVENPCHEKWSSFSPTPEGGFCQSCAKVVVDFTKMTDTEIITFFTSKKRETCGRFRADQLKAYSPLMTSRQKRWSWAHVALAGVIFFTAVPTAVAQRNRAVSVQVIESKSLPSVPGNTQLVRGVVLAKEDGSPLPAVNIVLKGSQVGTVSNEFGEFTFPQPLHDGDVLSFSFIGFTTHEYRVKTEVRDQVALEIKLALQMELDITGKVRIDDLYQPKRSWASKVHSWFRGI